MSNYYIVVATDNDGDVVYKENVDKSEATFDEMVETYKKVALSKSTDLTWEIVKMNVNSLGKPTALEKTVVIDG